MFNKFINKLADFRRCQLGVTLVEYGVALALAILVGAAALTALAGDIDNSLGAASDSMPGS